MGDEGLSAELARLIEEARAADARRARIGERHLRAAASGDATFTGVVLDLAERSAPLLLRTAAGRTVQGRIVLVARDALAVECRSGGLTYVRMTAVAWVRPLPDDATRAHDQPSGDRPPARDATFSTLVAAHAPERPDVAVVVAGEVLHGELRGAGTDVLTLRLGGAPPTTTYVATALVTELTVTSG